MDQYTLLNQSDDLHKELSALVLDTLAHKQD